MQIKISLPILELDPLPAKLDIASFCQELRKQLGLSKREMADLLGVEYSSYDHYEHGRREPTSQVTAKLFLLREKLASVAPQIIPTIKEKQELAKE